MAQPSVGRMCAGARTRTGGGGRTISCNRYTGRYIFASIELRVGNFHPSLAKGADVNSPLLQKGGLGGCERSESKAYKPTRRPGHRSERRSAFRSPGAAIRCPSRCLVSAPRLARGAIRQCAGSHGNRGRFAALASLASPLAPLLKKGGSYVCPHLQKGGRGNRETGQPTQNSAEPHFCRSVCRPSDAASCGGRQLGTHWKFRFFVPSRLVTMRVDAMWPDRLQYASADSIAANSWLSVRYT